MVAIEGRQVLVILVALLSASYKSSASEVSGEVEKVKLDIYYETLCPSSAKFIVEHLPKLFNSGLIHVTHLKLFPYGNADVFNRTIYCQDEYLPFINCVENVVLESFVYRRKYPQWQTCFEKLNLEAKPVTDCYGSARGKELELLYANETQALQPPQTYVPWVVVDGQPLYQDYENFISYICKAYKGTAVVPACNASVKVDEKGRKIKPFGVTKTNSSKLSTISSAITSWMQKLSALV